MFITRPIQEKKFYPEATSFDGYENREFSLFGFKFKWKVKKYKKLYPNRQILLDEISKFIENKKLIDWKEFPPKKINTEFGTKTLKEGYILITYQINPAPITKSPSTTLIKELY